MQTHYEVLGVPPIATIDEINAAYRKLALELHADTGADGDGFLPVRNAYECLKDESSRARYNLGLRMMRTPCARCEGDGVEWKQISFVKRERRICAVCGGKGFL